MRLRARLYGSENALPRASLRLGLLTYHKSKKPVPLLSVSSQNTEKASKAIQAMIVPIKAPAFVRSRAQLYCSENVFPWASLRLGLLMHHKSKKTAQLLSVPSKNTARASKAMQAIVVT